MKNSKSYFFCLLMMSVLFTSCFLDGKSAEEKRKEKQKEELQESLEELGESLENVGEGISKNVEGGVADALKGMEKALSGLKKGGDGETVETINFRRLKEFMPESFAGMERTKHQGSTSGIAGFKASVAKGKYEDGNKSINIEITDAGGLGSALMGMAAWSSLEIDEENDDGYKRTTTFDGHKALEESNTRRDKCSLNLIVGNRFIVTVKGRRVGIDQLKKFVKSIDLDELADLA